jgi:hypothetical protein
MGNLIVKNCAGSVDITDIKVTYNGQIVAQQTGQKIPNGHPSGHIPLKEGVYDVTVTAKDKNGNVSTATERIFVKQEGDTTLEIFQIPQEEKIVVRANLVQG